MAAFDLATIRMQRELLDKTARQLDSDRRQLARLPENSKSKMAEKLGARVAENTNVVRDLQRLIPFMEALNAEQPDAVPAEPYDAADLGPQYSDGYQLPGEGEAGQ